MNAISEIKLYRVNIDSTNQYDSFANKQEQTNFFNQHMVADYVKCNYIPRTSTIKVRGYSEKLRLANYGSYTNTYDGVTRTYYFFILSCDFKSRNVTELTIAIDLYQTYFFEFILKECFIEREHVSDDSLGANLISEDFELGEYMISSQTVIDEYNDICYILGLSDTDSDNFVGNIYGEIYQGFTLYYYNKKDYDKLSTKIKSLCDNGKGDSIVFIYTYPQKLIDLFSQTISSGEALTSTSFQKKASKSINIDCSPVPFMSANKNSNYTPHNNKLNTYPYSFIAIKNTSGEVCQLKREFFYNALSAEEFVIDSVLTQSPTITLTPMTYKGEFKSYDNTIELHGYPLCSWNNDTYANWFAQNRNTISANKTNAYNIRNSNNAIANNNYNNASRQQELSAYSDIIGIASNIGGVTSNPVGSVSGALVDGANTQINYSKAQSNKDTDLTNAYIQNSTTYQNEIRSIMAQIKDSQILPNTCRGDTTGNGLDVARGSNSFYIDFITVTEEIAKKIDKYFDMFGYQVNRIGTPNTRQRTRHDYIKTLNCKIVGASMGHEDIEALQNVFNNGLHIWHDYNSIGNYSLDNGIRGSEV